MQTNLRQDNKFEFLLSWWYRLSAPPEVSDTDPLHERERVRKGKLTSIALLIELLILLPAVYTVLVTNPQAIIPIIINILTLGIVAILNRSGKLSIAAIFLIITMELGLFMNVLGLVFSSKTGLTLYDLSLFDLFILPELLVVALFPPRSVFILATINAIFTGACIAFLPKSYELIQALNSPEEFSLYYRPLSLLIAGAFMSYLWMNSAIQEMKRANQAEEINKLMQEMTIRQQAEVQKKQQLEESIQEIVSVHAQVANGNFSVRVPLDQKNMLWSVAGSLNNLLARIQRWHYDLNQLHHTDQALQQLLYNIQKAKEQGIPFKIYKTGTRLDPLIAEISRGMMAHQSPLYQPASYRQISDPGFYRGQQEARQISDPGFYRGQQEAGPVSDPGFYRGQQEARQISDPGFYRGQQED